MLYANNKCADQPAHPRSLISAFVIRCLDSLMSLVSVTKISSLMLASVAEQASLSLTWSETPEDTFSHDEAQMKRLFSENLIGRLRSLCVLSQPACLIRTQIHHQVGFVSPLRQTKIGVFDCKPTDPFLPHLDCICPKISKNIYKAIRKLIIGCQQCKMYKVFTSNDFLSSFFIDTKSMLMRHK